MRVALFVTCLADTLYPAGRAGDRDAARAARGRGRLPARADLLRPAAPERRLPRRRGERSRGGSSRSSPGTTPIVTPSGSCAAHVREHVGELRERRRGRRRRGRWELSQFLVDRLGVDGRRLGLRGHAHVPPDLPLAPGAPRRRRARVAPASRRGRRARPARRREECCGFGGTFAVRNAAISTAMLDDKLRHVEATGADAVCACDSSCLMHIRGGLERRGSPVRRGPPGRGARGVRPRASRTAAPVAFEQAARPRSRTRRRARRSATRRPRSAPSAPPSSPRCPTGRRSGEAGAAITDRRAAAARRGARRARARRSSRRAASCTGRATRSRRTRSSPASSGAPGATRSSR